MSDVFILGTGFSKGISCEMPLLKELSARALGKTRRLVSTEHSSALTDDVEVYLTYLSQRYPWQSEPEATYEQAGFLKLREAIADVISEAEDKAFSTERPRWLPQILEYWRRKKPYVITFNYDTCIERAALDFPEHGDNGLLEDVEDPDLYCAPLQDARRRTGTIFMGDKKPPFSLLKLHGSTNWYCSNTTVLSGEQVYVVPVRSYEGEKGAEHKATYEQCVRDKVPLIIPPVTDKEDFYGNDFFRSIWGTAEEALQSSERVFCIGYSMPMTDLAIRCFLATIRPDPKRHFYIVNMVNPEDDETEEDAKTRLVRRYETALGGTCEIDSEFISTDEVIPSFVKWLTTEASSRTEG